LCTGSFLLNLFSSSKEKKFRGPCLSVIFLPTAIPLNVGSSSHAEFPAFSETQWLGRGQAGTLGLPASFPNLPLGNSSGTTTAEFGRTSEMEAR
jgi:hypothetical protein